MDWTVYWFQSLACFTFASVAMFSGITGAALMLPWFVIGFAVLDVPEITTRQAIASALFLETAAFSVGIYRYSRRRLIDWGTARKLAVIVLPAGILGALVSHRAPEIGLRLAYSVMLIIAAWLLIRKGAGSQRQADEPCEDGEPKELTTVDGERYAYCVRGLGLQRFISGGGAFMTGLISTGVGEVTVPTLILRSGFPIPVAAATSIVLVAIADIGAALTHFTQFILREGLYGVPWNLIVWGIPGMALGALLGSHFQGRVSERASRIFFAGLFTVLSVTFLVFTLIANGE